MKKNGFKFLFILALALMVGAFSLFIFLRMKQPKPVDADFEALRTELTDNGCLESTVPGSALELKKRFGLLEADYPAVFYFAPVTYMNVEETLIVEVRSLEEADRVEEAIRAELSTLKGLFENYGVDQFGYLSRAEIYRNGRYVVYVCGPKAEEALRRIRAAIER